jgi:hypothetical protein
VSITIRNSIRHPQIIPEIVWEIEVCHRRPFESDLQCLPRSSLTVLVALDFTAELALSSPALTKVQLSHDLVPTLSH